MDERYTKLFVVGVCVVLAILNAISGDDIATNIWSATALIILV